MKVKFGLSFILLLAGKAFDNEATKGPLGVRRQTTPRLFLTKVLLNFIRELRRKNIKHLLPSPMSGTTLVTYSSKEGVACDKDFPSG